MIIVFQKDSNFKQVLVGKVGKKSSDENKECYGQRRWLGRR